MKLNEKSKLDEILHVEATKICQRQRLLAQEEEEALCNAAENEQRYKIESHQGDGYEINSQLGRGPYGYVSNFETGDSLAWTETRDHGQRTLRHRNESLHQELDFGNEERGIIPADRRHDVAQLRQRTCVDGFIQESERRDQNWPSEQADRDVPYHMIQESPYIEGEGSIVRNRIPMSENILRHHRPVDRHHYLPDRDYPQVSQLGPHREWEEGHKLDVEYDRYNPGPYPCSTKTKDYEASNVCRNILWGDVGNGWPGQEEMRRVVVHEGEDHGTHDLIGGEHPAHRPRHMLGINRVVHHHEGHVMQTEVLGQWGQVETPRHLIHARGLAQRIGRRIVSRQLAAEELQPEDARNVFRNPRHISYHEQGYSRPRNHFISQNEFGQLYHDSEAHRELLTRQGTTMRYF